MTINIPEIKYFFLYKGMNQSKVPKILQFKYQTSSLLETRDRIFSQMKYQKLCKKYHTLWKMKKMKEKRINPKHPRAVKSLKVEEERPLNKLTKGSRVKKKEMIISSF